MCELNRQANAGKIYRERNMEWERQDCGERQTGVSSRLPRVLAFCEREKAENREQGDKKKKNHRTGWPRHSASFPATQTLQSRGGEADIRRKEA